MAEPKQTNGDYYRNIYIDTHYQRYSMALQMAQAETLRAYELSVMLSRQLSKLQQQKARIQSSSSMSEFEANLKIAGLENSMENNALQRQITVVNNVEKQYNIDSTLPSTNQAANEFGNALVGVADVEAAAKRYSNQVSGYSKGTNGAKATAASIYSSFQAAAYQKGGAAKTKFDANRSKISAAIAQSTGVSVSDMNTWQAQKDQQISDEITKYGGQALDKAQLQELRTKAKDPSQRLRSSKQSVLTPISTEEEKLRKQQQEYIEMSSRSPEETMLRAQTIYRETMSPMSQQQMAKRRQADILRSLPQEQKLLAQGYERVTLDQAKQIMNKSYKSLDSEEKAALEIYRAALKDRVAKKPVSFKIHEKIHEMYPEDSNKQELVAGYILRLTEAEGASKGNPVGKDAAPWAARYDAQIMGFEPGLTKEEKKQLKELKKIQSDVGWRWAPPSPDEAAAAGIPLTKKQQENWDQYLAKHQKKHPDEMPDLSGEAPLVSIDDKEMLEFLEWKEALKGNKATSQPPKIPRLYQGEMVEEIFPAHEFPGQSIDAGGASSLFMERGIEQPDPQTEEEWDEFLQYIPEPPAPKDAKKDAKKDGDPKDPPAPVENITPKDFTPYTIAGPGWAGKAATYTVIAPNTIQVVSPEYGNFVIKDGKVIQGSITRGSVSGWWDPMKGQIK